MARDKPKPPPVVKLHELKPGPPADCFALLAEKTRGLTRDGKPYYTCKFRDSRRTVSAMVWADSPLFPHCDKEWRAGAVYKLRGSYAEHEKYGPQIDLVNVREATAADKEDGFHEADFYERSRFDSDEMFAEVRATAERELKDEPLRRLVLGLLDRHADAVKVLPASVNRYYPYPGGWLEHTRNVVHNCLWLCDRYAERQPELKPFNRDLVIAAAVLHEIGRAAELVPGQPGQPPEPTVPGKLFGNLHLTRDLVRDAARDIDGLNPELLQLLEHVLLSYLVLPEWGSPRLPMVAEALILHHADDLDAKFEMYARHLTRDAGDGPFTERDPQLGKQLLKRREV